MHIEATSNRSRIKRIGQSVVLSALIVSCSGGGSGGDSAPVSPPPPPANSAPVIQFVVSTRTVFEQSEFVIDASDTSDPDIDSFEISFVQTSGPNAERLEDVNASASKWRAASLDEDITTEMQFDITATDARGASSSASVTIPIQGFSGAGKPVAVFDPGVTLVSGNVGVPGTANFGIDEVVGFRLAFQGSPNNPKEILLFGESGDFGTFNYERFDRGTVNDTVSNVSFLKPGLLTFKLADGPGIGSDSFSVLDDVADELVWFFARHSGTNVRDFNSINRIAIEKPCFVEPRNNTGQDFIWIGQRNRGFSVVRINPGGTNDDPTFESEFIDVVNDGRSYCHLTTTVFPDRSLHAGLLQ